MNVAGRLAMALVTTMLTLAPVVSKAQVFEAAVAGGQVASAALMARSVGQIIQEGRQAAQALIANGESTANVLVARAGDELNIAIENSARLFSDRMDKTLRDLDEKERLALIGIASAIDSAEDIGNKAYTFKDTLTLDTRSILGTVPFVKDRLVMQRIDGLSQLSSDQDFQLRIIGSYVGLPGEDHRSEISMTIDGRSISGLRTDPKEIHVAELSIPNAELKSHFRDRETSIVPAVLTVRQTFKTRLWGFLWNTDETRAYDVPVNLALYPGYAGTLGVSARFKIAGWKSISGDYREMTHSDHCERSCGNHHGTSHAVDYSVTGTRTPPQIGDVRISDASCSLRPGGTGGFDVNEGTSVSPSGSYAKCQIRFRTRPNTYRLTVSRDKYDWIREEDQIGSVDLVFGKLEEVRVPLTTTVVRITGRLSTGEKIDFLDNEAVADGMVKVIDRRDNLKDRSIFIRVEPPDVGL